MHQEKSYEPWWLSYRAGDCFLEDEKKAIDKILPAFYGYHLVQCASSRFASLVSASLISHRVLLNEEGNANWPCSIMRGKAEAIGIQNDSVDVVVLSHTLELAHLPHQNLREAHRILIPEGKIVITGMNPFSFWGLWTLINKLFHRTPGHLISPHRIKDWLHLLNFDLTHFEMYSFRLPLSNRKWSTRLSWCEHLAAKFLPWFGGGFIIVGVKKTVTLTPIRATFSKKREIWGDVPGVAGSASFKQHKKRKEE